MCPKNMNEMVYILILLFYYKSITITFFVIAWAFQFYQAYLQEFFLNPYDKMIYVV